MKSKVFLTALLIASTPWLAFADDEAELSKQEASLSQDAKNPAYSDQLKSKYTLTDEQLKMMGDKGMNNQQMTMAAQLAQSSGKTLDEVVKMRTEDKMGWGKIAKELGVPPGEIGKGISSMRHDLKEKRADKMADKQEKRADKMADKMDKREERKEKRAEKRQDKPKGL